MVRRFMQDDGASFIAGRHRAFPVASGALSAEEIVAQYREVLVDGFDQFVTDPTYLSEVVISANRIDRRKARRELGLTVPLHVNGNEQNGNGNGNGNGHH